MKNRFAHLADGTRVRVKHTPCPVHQIHLVGRREGDYVIGYTCPSYFPGPMLRKHAINLVVRKGADGNLWLVHVRKSERKTSPT